MVKTLAAIAAKCKDLGCSQARNHGVPWFFSPAKFFAPWKNALDIVLISLGPSQKTQFGPLTENSSPPDVPSWLRAWLQRSKAHTGIALNMEEKIGTISACSGTAVKF